MAWSIDTTSWDDSLTNWYNTSTPFNYYSACLGEITLQDEDNSGDSWDGLTTYTSVSGSTIEGAAVALNGWYTNSYTSEERDSVSGHELGHALGLADLVGGAEVMNGQTCGSNSRFCYYTVWGPQSDDVNGVNALY